MKNLTHLLTACAAVFTMQAKAQKALEKNTSTPSFTVAVEKILGDFPYNYKHITGDLVLAEGDLEKYASTINLPGSKTCEIGIYHSAFDTTASWQATMFMSDEFAVAAKEYKRLYQQLKACRLKMVDGSSYYLTGELDAAAEEKDFVVSTFTIQTADERYREFKVELEMLYRIDGWQINISMASKKKDSEVRPDWMESK
ncbi:MAG: hypothetical protein QM731_13945 [Chitinophagaceae bacterium]